MHEFHHVLKYLCCCGTQIDFEVKGVALDRASVTFNAVVQRHVEQCPSAQRPEEPKLVNGAAADGRARVWIGDKLWHGPYFAGIPEDAPIGAEVMFQNNQGFWRHDDEDVPPHPSTPSPGIPERRDPVLKERKNTLGGTFWR